MSGLFFFFILEDCVFDVVVEVCVVLILDEIDDFFDFFVGYKRALHTLKVTCAGHHIQQVAVAEKFVRTHGVENCFAVETRRNLECDSAREVVFDSTADDVDGRSLRCKHKMNTHGTRKSCNAVYGVLDRLFACGHEVGKLIDDNDDSRHLFVSVLLAIGVVLVNISVVDVGKELDTSFHLAYRPVERADSFVRVANNFVHKQVRNACVHAHFYALGVDENKTHVVGRRLIKQADDNGVYAAALACAGCTCDEHVR